jgi:serine/threonine protein kinase
LLIADAGCPPASPFEAFDKMLESNMSSSCFLPPSVASAAVSSAALGFDDLSEEDEESDAFEAETEDRFDVVPAVRHHRTSSVGASAFSGLNLDDLAGDEEKLRRKRMLSFAKHRRVSLCAAVLPPVGSIPIRRQTTFVNHGPGTLSPRNDFQSRNLLVRPRFSSMVPTEIVQSPVEVVCSNSNVLSNIFSFFSEQELLCYASPICSAWADAATASHACLMLTSMGFSSSLADDESYGGDDELHEANDALVQSVAKSMERPWKFLVSQFPWACYLSEGAFKKVFKVYNSTLNVSEALSVMDVERIDNKTAVAAELAVASMLSSLARRNICPNFIITRSVFTCPYEPPASQWGSAENKKPRGRSFDPRQPLGRKPREPSASKRGTFQYIRMELCRHGDAEEYIKRLPNEVMSRDDSRSILFQTAFALHVAADRFSMKHYDVKLLNIFLQDAVQGKLVDSAGDLTVLRYGLGDHVYALRMPSDRAIMAKLADYGTANVQSSSNGKPVTIGQFTTIENTPPDYLIQGDAATQGHGHDNFGLGLCMLHLFTGHAPYEEILEDVFCPLALKKKLRQIWVEDEYSGFNAVRTMILLDVDEDEGEPDETLYHTLYRYLVLFGIPNDRSQIKDRNKVWKAITQSLEGGERTKAKAYGKSARAGRKEGPDSAQFARDRKKYSLSHGNNKYIARARRSLEVRVYSAFRVREPVCWSSLSRC